MSPLPGASASVMRPQEVTVRIAIIGRGRLGRTLHHLLPTGGVDVALVGRSEAVPAADALVLAVPDRAIADLAAAVAVPGVVLLHCSGAADVDVLRPHRPAGSFHPLMTFPGPEVAIPDLAGVPAAVAGDEAALDVARAIAAALGMHPVMVPGDRRLYHAAAVIAGNFATVLLAEATDVLVAAGVDRALAPRMLAPLALQSLRNAADDPGHALTGPAVRGDDQVIDAHLAALEAAGLEGARVLYHLLTRRAATLAAERQL